MTKSYPELREEVEELHGEEIARMPHNNNIFSYYFNAPSLVRALLERGTVAADKLFSDALHASGDADLANFFDLWVRDRWDVENTMKEEELRSELEVEGMSESLFEIADELKELVMYIRGAKRMNRDYIFNTIWRLAKKAENDSGR